MKKISLLDFETLCNGATTLESDMHGPKVLRLSNGNILKIFRRKRLISSAAWSPYAKRFSNNCIALNKLGIPTPEIISVLRIPEIKRDAVLYSPLPGETIRDLRKSGLNQKEEIELKKKFLEFVNKLHTLGIYFRSLHLGNVVQTPSGALGLIDVADLKIHKSPLGRWLRSRNLKLIKSSKHDKDFIQNT